MKLDLDKIQKNQDQILETIKKAYEDSMRGTHLRFVVYLDGDDGKAYIFTDTAGGNDEPMRAWEGKDMLICSFNHQCWSPEDEDCYFRENLISYLNDQEFEDFESANADCIREYEEELSDVNIKTMFPNAYKRYFEDSINGILAEFDPDFYLTQFLTEGR